MRQLVIAAQGAQHVGRLQGGRGTGRTGRHSQILERHDQRLAFNVVEAQVQVVRNAGGHAAVDVQLFEVLDLLEETIAERLDTGVFGGHFLLGNGEGFAHADNLVRGQGTRTHAAFMAATVHGRFQANTRLAAHV
ncbi:hypothetical protein D9M71_362110 [compost metagenome]